MLVLTCNKINKSYIVDPILQDISFNIENGDRVGLIGVNGSGKTTLFNILNKDIPMDDGDIFLRKDMKIGYLKQHTKINSDKNIFDECMTIFEDLIQMESSLRLLEEEISLEGAKGHTDKLDQIMNRYSQMSEDFNSKNGYGYKSSIRGTLKGLGFLEEDFDKPVNVLSGGQKSRLSLAKLLLENPDILLLDEPTNHLDIEAISWLERFLKDYKGAVLIISHDRYFLDNVVNRIFLLEHHKLKEYNTNYTEFIKRRKIDLEIHQRHLEDQAKEIKRQKEIIERFKAYGGERYEGLAKSRQKMLDKIEVMEKYEEVKKSRFKFSPKIKSGQDVIHVEDLNKSFGQVALFESVTFNIYRGERVGLIGPNGVGKSTLFKILLGEETSYGGSYSFGHHVYPAYFDQEMSKLNLNKTIADEIWDENPSFTHYDIRTVLSQFMFVGDDIFKEISDLSGGEKGRLSLLKLMLSEANLLFMDEPTNHLDIDSKEVLEDAILDYEGTVFVISHDRYFLNRTCDKILELNPDGLIEYLGNYDYYLEKKNQINREDETPIQEKTKTQIRIDRKKEKDLLIEERRLKKEIKDLEENISKVELEIQKIDELLCDTEIYSDTDKVFDLTSNRESLDNKLNNLYDELITKSET